MKYMKNIILGNHESYSDATRYEVFFKTNIFLLLGIMIHLFYVIAFCFSDSCVLICVELLSVSALIIAAALNRKGMRYIPAIIMCGEIGLNSVLWAIFLPSGYSHYLFAFVALLGAYLFLELKKRHKFAITLYLFICVNIAHAAEQAASLHLAYENIEWFAYLSLNMVFIILVAELTINDIANEAVKAMYKDSVKKMENELLYDALTGVYNRKYFDKYPAELHSLSRQTEVCVAMLDIDHFKNINDTYGHDGGDEVLRFFSNKLKSSFRTTDIIVRWGGEEFVIILKGITLEPAAKILDNFRLDISKSTVPFNGSVISFTITAGVYPVKGTNTIVEAISKADKLLYEGKTGGRNRVISRPC